MKLQIFDVEHGACALLTCINGTRLMIDCGHNANSGWKPGSYLRSQGVTHLDMLAITNYDEDHVSGLPDLLEQVHVNWLWRNPSVSATDIKNMKAKNGMGYGIESLVNILPTYKYTGWQPPEFSFVERRGFYAPYPTFVDTNNLSMAIHLNIAGINFLFSGDLESGGWNTLLKDQSFRNVIANTDIFIAPHHGRESGIYPQIFEEYQCFPHYIIMSDKSHMYDTQKTLDYYSSKARGGFFRGKHRRVLTTRKDGSITFNFNFLKGECLVA
ncbi:TPA: ComEC/Rec2 family competence protein [Legionella pneumophila]|uniref:MBL fold metallo-hydrolase n=2 Tax=Legionella pneumophila TaxID=446 RepID=A0AAN5PKE2_LEGPN|nr:hypothetical protein [Legionella pneumophila]ERH45631.1 hypothetical protein N751_10445 [Legionella pneumophila str. Leg01/11]ERH46902.1 hypothetical protein N750_00120 [Legionella pneumophila str. Leg01/53]ERI47459.1 hypothetical protein N749_13880 [Legionella pneumophila str. Leg01/20]ANN94352.1 hypothetical protein A9P84_00930 [Legionella pneumophila]AOU09249.1 hypothetical protein A9F03_00860 [Legionella pneumophila]